MNSFLTFQIKQDGIFSERTIDNVEEHIREGSLDLSMSEITSITFPSKFSNCHRILLHLNQIAAFPMSIFHSEITLSLVELNLSRNNLKTIPYEIGLLENLKELYLDSNLIERLPQSFDTCYSLQILDVSYNRLQFIPVEILELKKLRTIFAGFNAFNILDTKPGRSNRMLSLQDMAFQASAINYTPTINKTNIPLHIHSDLSRPAPFKCSACKKPLWIPMKEYSLKIFNQVPFILESLYCSPVHFKKTT